MRQLLLTTAVVVPLGFGSAFAQQAEEGAEAKVQVIEPETVESPEGEAAAEDAEEEVQTLEVEIIEEGEDEAVATEGAADEVVVREQAQNELRVDWITDAILRSPDGETIGDIEDLILDRETGQLTAAVVGVGGFLGIGEKRIAVAWDQLQIDYDANEISAELTRDQADAAAEYVFRLQEAPPPPEGAIGTGMETGAGGVVTAPTAPPAADD